jgi:hypothetical protein
MTQAGSGLSGAPRRADRVHLCADRLNLDINSAWQSGPPTDFGFEYTALLGGSFNNCFKRGALRVAV